MTVITVRRLLTVPVLLVILLVPAGAFAQTSERIVILDNLGTYQSGEDLFVFGVVASILPDAFLVLQITNPHGDLCQIQQMSPLPSGVFLTDPISLSGGICGIQGDYDLRLFYGDHAKSSAFSVSGAYAAPGDSQLYDGAMSLTGQKILSVADASGLDMSEYQSRLDSAANILDLEALYADLWGQFLTEDAMLDVDPVFRPVASAAIDSNAALLESGEVGFAISSQIDRSAYSAIFYYEIGDTGRAILHINDAFEQIKNINPAKAEPRQLTFSELEGTLLSLMKKTDTVMNREVKEEIAFILARGTVQLFSDDISDLTDMLSKSRYLDIVSRKDTPLYRLVNSDWDTLRTALPAKASIADLLESKGAVDELHAAALLLRNLDKVDRFISSDEEENSDLASIIKPSWDSLLSQLERASTTRDILDSRTDIQNMRDVIEISSRLSKSLEIVQDTGTGAEYVAEWESLMRDVEDATTIDEILLAVSAFDSGISELRDQRHPVVSLRFEFEQLRQRAEMQADHNNLILIDQALQAIRSAEQTNPLNTSSKIDRDELLLTWASQIAPSIRTDLENSAQSDREERAADILQRARSIENLADLSLRKHQFLPGFVDFTDSIKDRLDGVRGLVAQNDLAAADGLVSELFAEWRLVSGAYFDDPTSSNVGYSLDELQRIKYREQLEAYSTAVSSFYNSGFDAHSAGYRQMMDEAYDLIEYGNFIDADQKIKSIGQYLAEHLPLRSAGIIYDISYSQESDTWTIQGSVDKQVMDRRENLYVTVYDMNGDRHSFLEFTDTRQGNFFTKWVAPADPGLYVVMLQYHDMQASQIANIVDDTKYAPRQVELDSAELAREFVEMEGFIEKFGGPQHDNPRIVDAVEQVRLGLVDRNDSLVDDRLEELERLIERYLPVRHRSAVIDAQLDGNTLLLSGAVQKALAFSEDLYVDIFDRRGELVESVYLKDSAGGMFSERLSVPFQPGVHVAQLEYHDLTVTDFFTVP